MAIVENDQNSSNPRMSEGERISKIIWSSMNIKIATVRTVLYRQFTNSYYKIITVGDHRDIYVLDKYGRFGPYGQICPNQRTGMHCLCEKMGTSPQKCGLTIQIIQFSDEDEILCQLGTFGTYMSQDRVTYISRQSPKK